MTQTALADDAVLDEEWLAAPAKRSRVRLALIGLLAASLCFLGGVLTQQHLGAAATTAASPAGAFPGAAAGGFPGGAAGAFPGGGQPGSQEQGTGTTSAEPDDSDAVIGTVVEMDGDVWVVEDLGGTRHEITVGADTDVVREQRLTPDDVTVGDRVDVTGTSSDRGLEADTVTLR